MSKLVASNVTKLSFLYTSSFGAADFTDPTHPTFSFGPAKVSLIGTNLTYDGTTGVTGGTVTGYQYTQGDKVFHTVSGLSEAATSFQAFAQTHTGLELFAHIFDGADQMTGSIRNDAFNGFAGNDAISGFDGNDLLAGGAGNDLLNGGLGYDTLNGGSGNDTLAADSGRDMLFGASGSDLLKGGNGNDILNGGTGDDRLIGGVGADIFVFSAGHDIINDLRTFDRLVLSDAIWNDVSSAQDFVTTHAKVVGLNTIITVGTDKLTLLNYTDTAHLAGHLAHDTIL